MLTDEQKRAETQPLKTIDVKLKTKCYKFLVSVCSILFLPFIVSWMWIRHPILCLKQFRKR